MLIKKTCTREQNKLNKSRKNTVLPALIKDKSALSSLIKKIAVSTTSFKKKTRFYSISIFPFISRLPFNDRCFDHIETSQLICKANIISIWWEYWSLKDCTKNENYELFTFTYIITKPKTSFFVRWRDFIWSITMFMDGMLEYLDQSNLLFMSLLLNFIAQKMKLIKISSVNMTKSADSCELGSHLLKNSLMKNFIFFAVRFSSIIWTHS